MIGASAVVGYQLGKNRSNSLIASLTEQVDSLRKGEMGAAVTKRVSQQMEDIAYQQKAVSDKQRERAEQQSALALEMRDRAEQESRAARAAEAKAVEALDEAETQRNNAHDQQKIAEQQRDQATHLKNVADTLNYRTLGRTLASTSMNTRDANNLELADLLAYASWYFIKTYGGNDYYDNTFKCLSVATDDERQIVIGQRGSVNAVSAIPGKEGACVAVSNYGEVELLTNTASKLSSNVLFQNKMYDFRDVWAGKNDIYALSHNGTLCIIGYNGSLRTVPLPADSYFKMIRTDSNTLLIAGRKSLIWYTFSTGALSAPVQLKMDISAITKRGSVVSIFYANGSYAEMDSSHKITEKTPLTKGLVTSACYDEALECIYLGMSSGTVLPFNKYNRHVETLEGHKTKASCMTVTGNVLVTGAYDKTFNIWALENLYMESGLTYNEDTKLKVAAPKAKYGSEKLPKEWVTPVVYTSDGWPMSICSDSDGKSVWIGCSSGKIIRLGVKTTDMAGILLKKIKRNLTQQEWERYIGSSTPYIKFK